MDYTLRSAVPGDLAAMAAWSTDRAYRMTLRLTLRAAQQGHDVEVVLAEVADGTAAGYGAIDYRRDPGSGYLKLIEVRPELRSAGIGGQVVTELEQRARRRGLNQVHLAVEKTNPRAVTFYERLGYRHAGSCTEVWPTDNGDKVADCHHMVHEFTGTQ